MQEWAKLAEIKFLLRSVMYMSDQRSGQFLGGLLLGAAVGAVAGLLTAPRPGKETRQIAQKTVEALPELVEDLSTSLQLQADRLSLSAVKRWDGTLDRLRDAVQTGLEAAQNQRQTLKGTQDEAN
jgi:gas vesicle protein